MKTCNRKIANLLEVQDNEKENSEGEIWTGAEKIKISKLGAQDTDLSRSFRGSAQKPHRTAAFPKVGPDPHRQMLYLHDSDQMVRLIVQIGKLCPKKHYLP